MVYLPTSFLAYYITLACLLFFLVRPLVSLATPKASLPFGLAALGPVLACVLTIATVFFFGHLGPDVLKLGYFGAAVLLWVGLTLAVLAVMGAARVDVGAMLQRFPGPSLLIAGGLGAGTLQLVAFFAPILPFPSVVLVTAGAACMVAGLLSLVDLAWPVRGALPPILERNRTPEPGRIFFPGFIAFFATGYLLLALFTRTDDPSRVGRIAELASMDILLAGWAAILRRHLPFYWAIERRPESVVWIFIRETRVIRGAARWTMWAANIGADNGQILTQTAASQMDAEHMCVTLAQMCPQATQGYSPQIRAAFSHAPASLRRGP